MEKFYWFWLCNIPKIGNKKIINLINVFGNPKEVYDAKYDDLIMAGLKKQDIAYLEESKCDSRLYNNYLNMNKNNIKMVTYVDDSYPQRLHEIYDKPACLYYKGKLPKENSFSVAVVGARGCSEYGRRVAYDFSRQLAVAGVNVISGMARGIDGAAHRGCLSGGGYTSAILACGVDECYPREHIDIYSEIEKTGSIISEYAPSTKPVSAHFPLRNRIISGLSDIVIVVEAREKSGSLITADMALEQGKIVMAVPGRITDGLSEGCNNLIKMGALIATSPVDVFMELKNMPGYIIKCENDKLNNCCTGKNDAKNNMNKQMPDTMYTELQDKNKINLLARREELLYSCLDLLPKNVNIIIEETGFDIQEAMEILLSLQIKGLVKQVGTGYYIKSI